MRTSATAHQAYDGNCEQCKSGKIILFRNKYEFASSKTDIEPAKLFPCYLINPSSRTYQILKVFVKADANESAYGYN